MKNQASKLNKIASCKPIGAVLLVLSVFEFLIFTHRLCYYVFEYDLQYSPIDYGRFNILSYFTVQSNFFADVYLFFAGLGIFGVRKPQKLKIAHPLFPYAARLERKNVDEMWTCGYFMAVL